MIRYYFGFLIFLAAWIDAANAQDLSYVDIYHPIAVREMHQYGIPASITLAQGILESGRGKSALAAEGNNHFGIKCHKGWEGPSMYLDDDAPDECFRVYENADESYKDHSIFLTTRSRYDTLFTFDIKDYTSWAHGLSACGYATNPKYPKLLIELIEGANLQRFDHFKVGEYEVEGPYTQPEFLVGSGNIAENSSEPEWQGYPDLREYDGVILQNRIQAVAYRGEALDSLCILLDLSMRQLSKYNDLLASEVIPLGSPIYRQPKKRRGLEKTVTVQEGDNMWLISQWQGIQLTRLYLLNNMIPGEEPAVGEVLHLRKPAENKPALRKNPESIPVTDLYQPVEAQDTATKTEEIVSQEVKAAEASLDNKIITDTSDNVEEGNLSETMDAPQDSIPVVDNETSVSSEDQSSLADLENVEIDSIEAVDTVVVAPLAQSSYEEETSNIDIDEVPAEIDMPKPSSEAIETSERSFHTVAKGETLFSIARLYDLTLMNLKQWNALEGVTIQVGQKLFVEPR